MALLTDFGTIPEANGILHPQTKHKWRVYFYGFGGPRGNTTSSSNDSVILTLQAIQGDRPKIEFDEIELHRYNSRAWVLGKHNYQPANWIFESDIGGRVSTIFQEQLEKQQAIIAPGTGRVLNSASSGQQYKFAMIAQMLDGDITPIESWAYEGCSLTNVDNDNLEYAVSDRIVINATIRYDHVRQLVTGIPGNATGGMAPLGTS